MIGPAGISRLFRIEHVLVKYGLERLVLESSRYSWTLIFFQLSPTRWLNSDLRDLPRGKRIRLALEELGPVFIKLGQMLSTRRDLLPDDIGDELALLQDRVKPFDSALAKDEIEKSLGASVESTFGSFESDPMASASVAQVHGATLKDGQHVIVKVLRPGIASIISRDVALMYVLADLIGVVSADGKRLRAREVVTEYDRTIHDELDLVREAGNAVTLRENHKDIDMLYVPQVYWDYSRTNLLVMERIEGIPIRDIAAMHDIGMDMKKLAEHGVEIFYTQVFKHNFFHADMHPGNIFVSRENPHNPQYIAVDFGIVGSLTEEDQRYLGENLLAFFQRDYRRVAQLHVDSGWVPPDTRVSEFETAIRSVCDPIFEKPLAEISFGVVLVQLFATARRFNMEVQPQLVLLQKTLLNIEGLGRQLYPELDLWATGKPFLQKWVMDTRGPAALMKRFFDQVPVIVDHLPELPMTLHALAEAQTESARATSGMRAGIHTNTVNSKSAVAAIRTRESKLLRYTLSGCTLLILVALLVAARIASGSSSTVFPWYLWPVGGVGVALLLAGLRTPR